LLRRLLSEHVTDATRDQLAKRVVEHLEQRDSRSTKLSRLCGSAPATTATGSGALWLLLFVEPRQPLQRYPPLRSRRADLARLGGGVELALGFLKFLGRSRWFMPGA
jgi:hypothetical protein